MTATLSDFLQARIADDLDTLEHVMNHLEVLPHKPGSISFEGRAVYAVRRANAEIGAKLRTLEWCSVRERIWVGTHGSDPDNPRPSDFVDGFPENIEDAVVLRFLALPYADHPDYDEAWRP